MGTQRSVASMSWTLPLSLGGLPVAQDPDVGGDAGVVEELLGEGDEGLEPVVLQDPAADLALAAAGVAGEQGRAVHDDGDPGAALLRRLHVVEHVLEEEELPVADPGRARLEPAGGAALGLGLHRLSSSRFQSFP
jgi:hypothetical protein